jgi:hypothetical protein
LPILFGEIQENPGENCVKLIERAFVLKVLFLPRQLS